MSCTRCDDVLCRQSHPEYHVHDVLCRQSHPECHVHDVLCRQSHPECHVHDVLCRQSHPECHVHGGGDNEMGRGERLGRVEEDEGELPQ